MSNRQENLSRKDLLTLAGAGVSAAVLPAGVATLPPTSPVRNWPTINEPAEVAALLAAVAADIVDGATIVAENGTVVLRTTEAFRSTPATVCNWEHVERALRAALHAVEVHHWKYSGKPCRQTRTRMRK